MCTSEFGTAGCLSPNPPSHVLTGIARPFPGAPRSTVANADEVDVVTPECARGGGEARLTAMALGPQQMPPQGAKALVAALVGGRRGGPEVSAVLDEAGSATMEFFNEGSGTAVGLQYVAESRSGELVAHSVGDLAPGATYSSPLRDDLDPTAPLRVAWRCEDVKGRVRAWSYDGRSKRLRRANARTAEAAFRALYP
jgi:hypothetical protein